MTKGRGIPRFLMIFAVYEPENQPGHFSFLDEVNHRASYFAKCHGFFKRGSFRGSIITLASELQHRDANVAG
jgi:hypothetical protein